MNNKYYTNVKILFYICRVIICFICIASFGTMTWMGNLGGAHKAKNQDDFMTKPLSRSADVAKRARARINKFEAKRAELANAALNTLAKLGYARTSLREIADNTAFSHGVFHYYFTDKLDLILQCVQQYKTICVKRYDSVVLQAKTPEVLIEVFLEKLFETLENEAHQHRLWYDLRSQALFEDTLRAGVQDIDESLENMIWRIIVRYAKLQETTPKLSSHALYALFDGLFQRALSQQLAGDGANAIAELKDELARLLPIIV